MPRKQVGAQTRKPAYKALVISDLHVGSTTAVIPRGFVTAEGNKIGLNSVQEFLARCWDDFERWAIGQLEGSNYALILNGDLIDGDHHGTKQIWSKDTQDQVAACVKLLANLTRRASRVYVVRGTESHTNNSEGSIARALNAEVNPSNGTQVFDRLHLTIHGCRCAWSHHIATSVRSNGEASALSSVLTEEFVQAARNGHEPRQFIGRAHRHKFGVFSNGRGTVAVSPPWQMLTRFGHKVAPEARTQPGGYILDWSGKPLGALPEVVERTYDAPEEPELYA